VEENLRREGRGKRSQSKEKNLCFFKERRKKNKSEEARAGVAVSKSKHFSTCFYFLVLFFLTSMAVYLPVTVIFNAC
jgi:Flp pilus assembly protein TadB